MRRLVACTLIALAGCGVGNDEKSIDEARIDELLLQPADVGTGFRSTHVRNLDRRAASEVRYRRAREPLSIESAVRVFGSSEAAEKRLDAEREEFEEKPGWRPIGEPGLGDESFAATLVEGGVRSYTVYWRHANATASLDAIAPEDELPFADVLELARKQQRRIAEAGA
jgi:hypothetical protein